MPTHSTNTLPITARQTTKTTLTASVRAVLRWTKRPALALAPQDMSGRLVGGQRAGSGLICVLWMGNNQASASPLPFLYPSPILPQAGQCYPCESGFFKELEGLDVCTACNLKIAGSTKTAVNEEGDLALAVSWRNCTCTRGYYLLLSQGGESTLEGSCVPCPAGTDCYEDGTELATLNLKEGYWRTSERSKEILSCPIEEACSPHIGKNGSFSPCAENHQGPLCTLCVDGFARSGDSCVICSGSEAR